MQNIPPNQDPILKTYRDFHWRWIWRGFAISLALTLIIGAPLMIVLGSIWALAWTAVAALWLAGILSARAVASGEPLNGAMIAMVYFALVAIIYLVGQALEILPDPLPGLAADDSTFFFVWPLAQILAGTLGSIMGGLTLARRKGKS
jgi:hypothetical protein